MFWDVVPAFLFVSFLIIIALSNIKPPPCPGCGKDEVDCNCWEGFLRRHNEDDL